MGYYSDLYIKCTNDVAAEMCSSIVRQELSIDSATRDDKYTYFTLYGKKWYGGYDEVDAINATIQKLGNQGKCTMIRDGEDREDIEESGAEPDTLGLWWDTSIQLDGFGGDKEALPILQEESPEYFI